MSIDPHPDLTAEVVFGLGWMYLILFVMNAAWTWRSLRAGHHMRIRLLGLLGDGIEVPGATFWAAFSALLLMASIAHFTGYRNAEEFFLRMPEPFKDACDAVLGNSKWGPVLYFLASIALLWAAVVFREWWVRPTVAWTLLNATLVFMALSMTDYDFRQIVGKPDNVPIVSMLFIVAFFTWLYFKKAVENDQRIKQSRPLLEQEDNEKILVWPDLVYSELICMVVVTAILIVWGILLQAPLEEPASAAKTPNPSKAPWYFLGLQEMLVYYDPWLAGVVFPSLIIVGLMAIPYIDFNRKGSGYYTFEERPFSVVTFLIGFLPLWVAMIVLGTFLRGPNWNVFGIYEYWDVHKLAVLTNVNLSQYFWVDWLHMRLPTAPPDAGGLAKAGYIFLRESPGIISVLVYFLVLPPLLAGTVFRSFFEKMGFVRYMVLVNLLLLMAALPIKMVLRWAFNLKYIVAIPEWFFNI